MVEFGRLFTAMVTPMRDDGAVDIEQAKRLATALLESGSDGLVACGTTGEASTLEFEEERALFRELLPICHARNATLVAGTGSNSTRTAIESSRRAEEIGVDALLLVVPYYNKPSQEGMYQHFRTVAEAVSTPCILYNVPSRTSINMTSETTLRLSQVDNIVGVKEASSDLDQIQRIIGGAPDGFRVWSGNDNETFYMMSMGGYGVVSVVSHLVGQQIKQMMGLILEGDIEKAAAEHHRLMPIFKMMFVMSNPIPVKYSVNQAGFNAGIPRLPLVVPDEKTAAEINELVSHYKIDLPVGAAAR